MKYQTHTAITFGEFFRKKRVEKGYTLRSFCRRFGYDPANISRLETNKAIPPESREKLEAYTKALGIKKNEKDWVKFFDLAYITKGKLPPEIYQDASEAINILPAFFRTPDGKKISRRKVKKLINFLQNNAS